jgi:ADP-ribose pyrophosphatase YjhB (NUDIX family)
MIHCEFEDGGKASLRHVCADVLVLKDGKLLMVKRTAKLLEGGKWGLVGGFAERDETIAEAAGREVFEETGWQITGLTLLTINDSPVSSKEDRQNVVLVYFATATEQTGTPDWESDDQQWYDFSALPSDEMIAFDHLDNIKLYQRYLTEQLSLPLLPAK